MTIRTAIFSSLLILGQLLIGSPVFAETRLAPQHEIIAKGETKLSPYFSVSLEGNGWLSPRILRTYHHENGKKTLLGFARFSKHASRQNGYALSEDGMTLLYFHQKLPGQKKLDKRSGLYEFRHGRGDQHLHHFINNSQYLPVQVPANTLVFTKLSKRTDTLRMDSEIYLRDTNGNEKRWQP